MRILEYIMKKRVESNIDKLEEELYDILNLNKVLTHIEGKKSITPPKKQPIKQKNLPRYQQPKYNQQNLRYQPRHHPQPQQYQYYHPQYNEQYQYYQYYHPQYNQQYPRYQYYHPQYNPQYPLYQQKNKIPTIDEMCIEKGYVKGPKKPIINKRTPKIPTVDEICIEKGYLKPSVKSKKKTSTVSSGELFGGSNFHRPKKTQKSKPKPRKSK